MSAPPPTLSVVIAARDPGPGLTACLGALRPQMDGRPVDCLIVCAGAALAESSPTTGPLKGLSGPTGRTETATPEPRSADSAGARPSHRDGSIGWLHGPEGALVPELWALGILASQGAIVALTAADCAPQPGWIDKILATDWSTVDAIGGGFEVAEPARARDRALLFARYWAYPPTGSARPAVDLAADNVAYRREALESCRELWSDGFWEPPVHRRMREMGMRLVFDPAMRVAVRQTGAVSDLARQRFAHGRRHAARRSGALTAGARLLRVLGAPLVPAVLMLRIIRSLADQQRLELRHLFAAKPYLLLYLSAWALGEMAGYAGRGPSPGEAGR